jgi:UDP-N-acetylmuramoyl-L-alanyl-D-glutamate--2,6-diaminopimelate ligase
MTTGLREPKNASESDKAVEERKLTAQALKNRSLTLEETFLETGAGVPSGAKSLKIEGIACDSRKVAPGYLFFALHGAKEDGNQYIQDAIKRGAVAIASEIAAPDLAPADLPATIAWVRVAESRKSLAVAAANFFGHPAKALQLIAVTGTNGKTTTTSLIDAVLRTSGAKTGLFGTIAYHTPKGEYPAPNTTPESLDLQGFFSEIRDAGGKYGVLEASSHALVMDRLWGCHFESAVFTNLTREHMDFHRDFEDYFAAKRRLFEGTGAGAPETALLNADDPYSKRLAGLSKQTLTYGIENAADLAAKKIQLAFTGLTFTAHTPNGRLQVVSPLVGRINVYNILAAIGAAQAAGISNETIEAGIRALKNIPGRFQRVDMGQPFLVIVDFAHTDDALQNLVKTARELNPKGRVITLFGCGGGKDRTKRPVMGEVSGRMSDLTILTNDNPRAEDPLKIISDIVVGMQRSGGKYLIEPDREKAIGLAFDEARAGDIVLVAGKGHEDYQVLADRTVPWDDRRVAQQVLRQRGFDAPGSGERKTDAEFGA